MKKLIPQFLKYPLITLYILWRCLSRGQASSRRTNMNLSGVLPPPGKIIHGGKVKLLHIRERFGDSWKHFNTAYFASSGLPFAPAIWLRLYKLFGIKTVWNQNGFAYPAIYPGKVVNRVNGLMKPLHLAHFVVFQTEFTKHCSDKFIGPFKGQYEIIINPIDTTKFAPRETSLPLEPLVIIMSGNHFESGERMKISLEAIKKVREQMSVKLILIGQPDFEVQEDWIEKTGPFTQQEAPSLYRQAHILLHMKYLDPCPTVVLEALATGLPVIGQGNGGMPELVNQESGILLPVSEDFNRLQYPEAEAVAEAIIRVRENLSQYSQAARAQALKFDKEIWLKKHEEIFNKLLS